MKKLLLLIITCIFTLSLYAQQNKDIETVKATLFKQAKDWNNGDIDSFMENYWKSEKLQFIGGNGVTYGWQQTLENYKKRYPDRAAMGKLTFKVVNVEKLSRKVIMLVGTWDLEREKDNPGGYYILIWKKIRGEWVIIADHTSSRSE